MGTVLESLIFLAQELRVTIAPTWWCSGELNEAIQVKIWKDKKYSLNLSCCHYQ